MAGAERPSRQCPASVTHAGAGHSTFRSTAPLHQLERLRVSLCAFVANRCQDPSQVEDVVQETLIRFLSCACDDQHHVAYAKGIAKHVICDLTRANRREVGCDPVRLDRTNVTDDSLAVDPLRSVALEEEFHPVRIALRSLSPVKRHVIEECYLRDLSCAEIARRDGVPPARLRKEKSRALHELRERLHSPPRS